MSPQLTAAQIAASCSARRGRSPARTSSGGTTPASGAIDPGRLSGGGAPAGRAAEDLTMKLTSSSPTRATACCSPAATARTCWSTAAWRRRTASTWRPRWTCCTTGRQTLDVGLRLAHRSGPHRGGPAAWPTTWWPGGSSTSRRANGNPDAPSRPTVPRPPEVLKVWNNSFHEQVGDNAGDDRGPAGGDAPGS